MNHRVLRYATVVLGAMLPVPAVANAGVPMLALAWPAQWLALVPIIAVEATIIGRGLGVPPRSLAWPVTKANLLSTLFGVPIAWLAMLVVEFVVAGAFVSALPEAWANSKNLQYVLFPFTAAWVGASSPWEVFAAFLVLAVPFCVVSIYIEHRSLRKLFPEHAAKLRALVRLGNIATYAFLSLLALLIPLTA